jgi:rhodanese-related sulfurtransferase
MSALTFEVTPAEAKSMLAAGTATLIDVREAFENQICSIAGSELIPMNTIPARVSHLETLADVKTLVVYCHHGMRSLSVVNWMRQQGIDNCQSLAGGIDQWSQQIDPSVPRY